jgi:hypothetical protein
MLGMFPLAWADTAQTEAKRMTPAASTEKNRLQ